MPCESGASLSAWVCSTPSFRSTKRCRALTAALRAATMPPCWSRRRAPARPRACRWCCSTSRGRRTRKSWCWSRAGSPRAPRPSAWRRRSARSVGETVGLRVRFGSKVSRRTRIEVVTEGMFTRLILDDPSLDGVAAVLFDEFHERSLDADLGLALARDVQQGLRDDLQAPGDVGDARRRAGREASRRCAGDRKRGPRLSGRDALSRPRRRARRSSGRWRTRWCARCAPSRARCWCSCPGQAEIRRTETLLQGARQRSGGRHRAALRRARCATPGPRHRAGAAGPAQGRAGDLDRRDLAHHRGRARRHRQRARAGAALRAGRRPDAARDRARVARRRRPAPRPRRPHRARRLLPAVGRAADRVARSLCARRRSSPPTCRACCSISRNGARPIRASSPSSIRRRAGALTEARALLAELGAIDARAAASPTRAGSCARLPLPPRLARMVVDAAARRRGPSAPPRSPRCCPSAGSAATTSISAIGSTSSAATARAAPRTRGAMAKRWADDRQAAAALAPTQAARRACRRRDPVRSPIPTASPRAAARTARSCSPMAAAPMSIRRRRWRASRSSPWPSSPAPPRRAASCSRRRSRSTRSRQRFADRIERREEISFDAASASLRGRRSAGSARSRWPSSRCRSTPSDGDRAHARRRHRAARHRPAAVDASRCGNGATA